MQQSLGSHATAVNELDTAIDSPEESATRLHYAPVWKIWVPIVAVFVLLDVTFNLYFWRIPKLTKANADYGYEFMKDAQALWHGPPAGSRRVLAFGSSIALSFVPGQVESLLGTRLPAQQVDVHRLLLPGIHPSDYLMFFRGSEMEAAPDAVVILLNLVDFLYANDGRDVNPTLRFILPPWSLLAERHENMSITSKLDTVLAGTSRLYRFRKPIRSSVQDHLRALGRWLRSSAPKAPYGIYDDGYTKQAFAVPAASAGPTTVEYFIDPEWLRQRGAVSLRFSAAGETLAMVRENDPGWKSVSVDLPEGAKFLEATTDSLWTPRAGGGDDPRLLGVLLRTIPAGARADGPHPFRYRLGLDGEIDDFLRMRGKTGEELLQTWNETLEGDSRFAQRFRVYRDAKLELTSEPFVAGADYEAVRRLVELFRARGSAVIIINTPESPWILDRYRERAYYRGYLAYLSGLATASDQVWFLDWSDKLPAEDFNDWHHPSYIGSIKLGERYAAILEEVLPARAAGGH